MQPTRTLIDISVVGRTYSQHIKDILGKFYSTSDSVANYNYIFQNSCQEVILAMAGDLITISKIILSLPNRNMYSHIQMFENNEIWTLHSEHFRNFALGVIFEFHNRVGYNINADYLLEQAREDCIVIQSYPKGYQVRK